MKDEEFFFKYNELIKKSMFETSKLLSKPIQCFSLCKPTSYDLHIENQSRWTILRGMSLNAVM